VERFGRELRPGPPVDADADPVQTALTLLSRDGTGLTRYYDAPFAK
jgi:hypothetical protein